MPTSTSSPQETPQQPTNTSEAPREYAINPHHTFTRAPATVNMPAPDISSWESKLNGKLYIGPTRPQADVAHAAAAEGDSDKVFKPEDLPEKSRVIPEGGMVTRDYVEERLNVYLDSEGKCKHCSAG